MRHSLRLLAVAGTLALASCIDGHEEYWLEADGSGRADVTYSLPAVAVKLQGGEAGVRKLAGDFLAGSKAFKASTCDVRTEGDRLVVRVTAAFGSALDLKDLGQGGPAGKLPPSASGLAGNVAVLVQGRTLDFSRTISAGNALPGAVFLPRSRFAGRKLEYVIHLPDAAVSSNATATEDGGRTLKWIFPLAEALEKPVVTRFTVKVPIPRRWLAAAGGALVAGLLLLGRAAVRRRAARL